MRGSAFHHEVAEAGNQSYHKKQLLFIQEI